MHFEARELTTYASPVHTGDLVVGEYYFQLTFIDDDMCIPSMNTVVYIGQDIMPGDARQFYFQDADSYVDGMRISDGDNSGITLHCCDENSLNNVFEFEHALEGLMRCSLRRKNDKPAGKRSST